MTHNDTVGRIVDLLFQDVQMNEEVQALYDETMTNCQERYADMISRGLSEDDAIAAVVDSLKGMEDIISQYPVKEKEPSFDEGARAECQSDYTFDPSGIKHIEMVLVSEDITVERSQDNLVHVHFDPEEDAYAMLCALEDGTLNIRRNPDIVHQASDTMQFHGKHVKFETNNGATITFESAIPQLTNFASKILRSMNFITKSGGMMGVDSVTIALPEKLDASVRVLTTSGDTTFKAISAPSVNVTSTSGEINFTAIDTPDLSVSTTSGDIYLTPGDAHLRNVTISTTSGEIQGRFSASDIRCKTVSGDMRLTGNYDNTALNSVSGEIEYRGETETLAFNTVSGDVEITATGRLSQIRGNTVSGEIELEIPEDIGTYSVSTTTRAGDVCTRFNARGTRTLTGSLNTNSGDITVC